MKIEWTTTLTNQNYSEPEFQGLFRVTNGSIMFYYKDGNDLVYIGDPGWSINKVSVSNAILPLPRHWLGVEQQGESFLLCGEEISFRLSATPSPCQYDGALRQCYTAQRTPVYHYENDSFNFEEFIIEHVGEFGYVCKKDGKICWSFTGRGYLYTEMYNIQNSMYFGTAGRGGYLYIINIETGEPILSLNTGGTTQILTVQEKCFVAVRHPKNSLLCIDLITGRIVDGIDVPGAVNNYSRLHFCDNKIYLTTFQYRSRRLQNALLSCISVL